LDGTNQIKFLNRGHYEDDDAPLPLVGTPATHVAAGPGHVFASTMQLGMLGRQALIADLAKIV